MRIAHLGVIGLALTISSIAFAQESEFQGKIQEDLDGYKAQLVSTCGTAPGLTLKYNGKLGSNPRETQKGNYSAVSSLCTGAVDALGDACRDNAVVKKNASKITSVICQPGHGTIGYSLSGSTITFSVDPAFTGDNVSGQAGSFATKIKKDMDK
jgi:hypothetical protein